MVEGGGGFVRGGEGDEVSPVDVLLPDLGVSLRHPAVDDFLSVCLSVEARSPSVQCTVITMLLCALTVSACAAWKETRRVSRDAGRERRGIGAAGLPDR